MKIFQNSIICTLLFFNANAFGQQACSETLNTTTTDWRVTGTNNVWNWTQKGAVYPVYLYNNLDNATAMIAMPYFHVNVGGTGTPDGYQNVSNYLFRGQNKEQQDINPEDGWELLLKDFGTPNTSPGNNTGVGRTSPYFILYNRVNGKMKIFVAVFGSRTQQSGIVRIGFSDNNSTQNVKNGNSEAARALFSHGEPIAKTIIEFKSTLEYKQLNQIQQYPTFGNTNYQWFVAELLTSYDPCTCENPQSEIGKKSILQMQVVVLSTASINATIDGSITQQSIASGSNVNQQNDGFLSFFNAASKAGLKGYEDWNKAKNTADKIVNYGSRALQKELVRAWYKKDNIAYASDDPILNNLAKDGLKKFFASPDSFKIMMGVKTPKDAKFGKFLNSINGVASALPYVGAAIGVLDLLVNGGEKQAETPKMGPVTYDVSLKLTGSITEYNNISDVQFFTPGSPIPSNTGDYLTPIYNNVLGVFNVLDLPQLEYAELTPSISNFTLDQLNLNLNQCEKEYIEDDNFDGALDVKLREYRPKSNIKYVLNPAANLNVESIEAAIVLEYNNSNNLYINRPDKIGETFAIPYHDLMSTTQSFLDTNWCWWLPDTAGTIWSGMDPTLFQTLWNQGLVPKKKYCDTNQTGLERRITSVLNSQGLELEYVSKAFPYDTGTIIRFRTKYVPITCFKELNFMLLGSNNYGKAFVKFYIKLKRNNLPNSEPVIMILTYDYTSKLIDAEILNNISGSYFTSVSAKHTSWKERCCFKCGPNLTFTSPVFKDFKYATNFNLSNIPFGSQWYTPQKATYSSQQFYTAKESLIIPENSIIPNNSIIKAAGIITIEKNVTIGTGSKIISGIKINVQAPNTFWPQVELKIEPINEILFNCTNYNYESMHNTVGEINQFCSSSAPYLAKVYTNSVQQKEDSVIVTEMDFRIYPNPNYGEFNLVCSRKLAENGEITLYDIEGRQIFQILAESGKTIYKINATNLPQGIYILRLVAGKTLYTNKVIIQN